MQWKGELLFIEGINRDTQFTRLLSFLLHYPEAGVDREMLKSILFEDSKSDDVSHMLRSVIYNSKRRLQSVMPDAEELIVYKKGKYFWTDAIEVVEDAKVFEGLCNAALAEDNPERKKEKYLDACYAYKGRYLPSLDHLNEVNVEGARYSNLFKSILETTVKGLIKERDFEEMEKLGRYAAHVQPFDHWECIVFEAMLSLGQHERVEEYYDHVIRHYIKVVGANPATELIEKARELGIHVSHRHAEMSEAMMLLNTGRPNQERRDGATICDYPVFQGIYHFMQKRHEEGCSVLLCTLVDKEDRPVTDNKVIAKNLHDLEAAIYESLRVTDAICRFGRNQYAVLLTNRTAHEDSKELQRRITGALRRNHKDLYMKYDISEVLPPE